MVVVVIWETLLTYYLGTKATEIMHNWDSCMVLAMINSACKQSKHRLLLLQLFYSLLSGTTWVSRYQKKHLPTHPSWSSSNLYQLLPSTTIHGILPAKFTWLTIFFAQPLTKSSLVYLLVWSSPPRMPYISLPNQCLLFATHAHTIAACFAVVPRLYHLLLVSPSTRRPFEWYQYIGWG